VKSPVVMH